MQRALKIISINLINIYQICISPFISNNCIYDISCSEYAKLALRQHFFCKAIFLIAKRILSCNPWNKNYD